ncbi:MAG: nucleotidyltransferase domain-containing protein [Campylobacterota bacterium]|nr:nucleotidyltransferase domain-containing protein [Campylobacterota bacterium]
MIDIEKIVPEIIDRLKSLHPNKIILFGSYANGQANDNSDIDLFLVKDIREDQIRKYRLEARKSLRDLIFKYQIGFDILAASEIFLKKRKDYFYQVDILKNGKVIYE